MIWEVCKPFPSVLGLQEWAKFAFFVIFCASGLVSGSQSDLQLAPFGSPCSWAPAPVAEHPMCFRAFWWHSSLCWSVCFGVVFFLFGFVFFVLSCFWPFGHVLVLVFHFFFQLLMLSFFVWSFQFSDVFLFLFALCFVCVVGFFAISGVVVCFSAVGFLLG